MHVYVYNLHVLTKIEHMQHAQCGGLNLIVHYTYLVVLVTK